MLASNPIVFIGPSLAFSWPSGVDRRPPAVAGDLLRLAGGPPRVVALIDGMFDHQPAVQHKEILELISRRFVVLGASSMGALRAAELARFGMIGVGAIYSAYTHGLLTGDDEVALLHAPESLQYRPVSEPLVDVRATLVRAVRKSILDRDDARAIRGRAKEIFWRDRDWPAILNNSKSALSESRLTTFRAWLPGGKVSLKSQDAQRCVAYATRMSFEGKFAPQPPRTVFFRKLALRHEVCLTERLVSGPA